jgi:septum formation protein
VSELILASNSPRRQQILKDAGVSFIIKTKDIEEIYPESVPQRDVPLYLAKLKATAFKEELDKGNTIITADTVVLIKNEILGKPKDHQDAIAMLKKLSGNMHEVITGVNILSSKNEVGFSDVTEVYFNTLSESDIEFYISQYKPFDKAGSYGIQEFIGYIGIDKIVGSYFNVMGLPIHRVIKELRTF